MESINAGLLHDYAGDVQKFNKLLIENPGIKVEDNVYYGRNVNRLIDKAIENGNFDMIYWLMDQKHLSDNFAVSSALTMFSRIATLEDHEHAKVIHQDVINRYKDQLLEGDADDIGHRSWVFLRTCFQKASANRKQTQAAIKDNFYSLLNGIMPGQAVNFMLHDLVSNDRNHDVTPDDLADIFQLIKKEDKPESLKRLWVQLGKSSKSEHLKALIDCGADPFDDDFSLINHISDPNETQKETIATVEHYAFSKNSHVNVTDDKDDAVNNLMI